MAERVGWVQVGEAGGAGRRWVGFMGWSVTDLARCRLVRADRTPHASMACRAIVIVTPRGTFVTLTGVIADTVASISTVLIQ